LRRSSKEQRRWEHPAASRAKPRRLSGKARLSRFAQATAPSKNFLKKDDFVENSLDKKFDTWFNLIIVYL
jgi:hypothetical protein